jgi:hypothetical protein
MISVSVRKADSLEYRDDRRRNFRVLSFVANAQSREAPYVGPFYFRRKWRTHYSEAKCTSDQMKRLVRHIAEFPCYPPPFFGHYSIPSHNPLPLSITSRALSTRCALPHRFRIRVVAASVSASEDAQNEEETRDSYSVLRSERSHAFSDLITATTCIVPILNQTTNRSELKQLLVCLSSLSPILFLILASLCKI